MKNKKVLITVFFQLIIVGVLGFLIYTYVNTQIQPVTVYQYKEKTLVNTVIDETILKKNLETKIIAKRDFTPNMVVSKEELIGKAVNTTLYPNQLVYKEYLIEQENINIFETMDLSGYRKVALPIEYLSSFGGNLKPGDKVDLFFVGKGSKTDERGNNVPFNYSKQFLPEVLVYKVLTNDGYRFNDHSHLAIGENVNEVETVKLDGSNLYEGELGMMVLLVSPEELEELYVRLATGVVKVAGRFEDSKTVETVGFVSGEYEKLFLGNGNAETSRTDVAEDTFEEPVEKPVIK